MTTNRLPEVGNIYRHRLLGDAVKILQIRDGGVLYRNVRMPAGVPYYPDELSVRAFQEMFEELPNQEQKSTPYIDSVHKENESVHSENISRMEPAGSEFKMTQELGEELDRWLAKKYSDKSFIKKNWHRDYDRQAIIVTTMKEKIIPFNMIEKECEKEFNKKTGSTTCRNCDYYSYLGVVKGCEKESKRNNLSVAKEEQPWHYAFHNLKAELARKRDCHFTRIEKLEYWAQQLVNALDDQNRQEKAGCCPELEASKCSNCGKTLGITACKSSSREGVFCSVKCADDSNIPEKGGCGIKNEPVKLGKLPWLDLNNYPQEELQIMRFKNTEDYAVYFGHFDESTFNDLAMGEFAERHLESDNIEHISITDFLKYVEKLGIVFEQLQNKVEEMEKNIEAVVEKKIEEMLEKQREEIEEILEQKVEVDTHLFPIKKKKLQQAKERLNCLNPEGAVELIIEILEGKGR